MVSLIKPKPLLVPKGQKKSEENSKVPTDPKDKEKFPNGPWCKEGQFIMYGRYVGNRFQTKYGEHRILNDDEIIGTIKDPKDILHLF
jgi:co-chaperonin GroES (HSP10)